MRVGKVFLDLLFPPKCAFCEKLLERGEEGICAECRRALPRLTGSGAEQEDREFVTLVLSPLRYRDEVRRSVHRYKFEGCRSYADVYARLMAACFTEHGAPPFDVLTWVPVSDVRRRERGYDQAELLARALGKELGTAPVPTLRKIRNNQPQSGLEEAAERRANVQGAYECTAPEQVSGLRILLIDDVITTGATVSECARVLRDSGAAAVSVLTLSRAH